MYKTIHERPTNEQIAEFGMQESHEDMITDYRIKINLLSDKKKKKVCDLYNIDPKTLMEKEILTLSFLSEV